jgi:predicted DNA-binding ribbon-helix-helix protein
MTSSEKVIARSFRLDKRAFEGLEHIAREKNVTVNSVVRDIVDQYVDYEYSCSKLKVIHVDATFLKFLTDIVPREKLIEFAKSYANTIEGGLSMRESYDQTVESLINEMRIQSKYNSEKLVETTHESKRIVILVHEVGLNYSVFVANYYKALFELIGVKVDYTADENAVVLKFES